MRRLDEWLLRWRAAKAVPFVRKGDRLLDVGCFDGHLIRRVRDRVAEAVGVDPLAKPYESDNFRILADVFPGPQPFDDARFDCVTMLAVLEHLPDPVAVATECFRVLKPDGRVIITVPAPAVDRILDLLMRVGLVDGMCVEQHHGFEVQQTADIFRRAGFELLAHRPFQLGLNHLFVFSKPRALDTQPFAYEACMAV